jgi:putative GTP pyrophosphokinase
MTKEMSKTQIDRLGDRLKKGNITEDDLRLLDQYRRSFAEIYEFVVGAIRNELRLEPTGRPAKSTTSISDKLRRESIRLTQIQDIAGCRLIVTDIANQESVIQSLKSLFEETIIIDRRERPSHGYRAVHVVVKHSGKLVEIQVRTSLQQLWAELSEKFADVLDSSLKYGGGDKQIQDFLTLTSSAIEHEEAAEVHLIGAEAVRSKINSFEGHDKNQEVTDIQQQITYIQKDLSIIKQDIFQLIRKAIEGVDVFKGENDDISD